MGRKHEDQMLLVAIGCQGTGAVILGAQGNEMWSLIADSGDGLHDLPDWDEDDHPTTPGLFIWEGRCLVQAYGDRQTGEADEVYHEWNGKWRVATIEDLAQTLGAMVMKGKIPVDLAPGHDPAAIDLDGIEAMAVELEIERARILGKAGAGPDFWGKLSAWAQRGERYCEIVRDKPPEQFYRALIAEIRSLRQKVDELTVVWPEVTGEIQ
jgi:hypothetical protein